MRTARLVLAPVMAGYEPAIRAMLTDESIRAGVYPFLDRRDVAGLVFDGDGGDLRAILVDDVVAGAVGMVEGEILIFVAPAVRRSGVAALALASYLAELAASGQAAVTASTARSNMASRGLLTKAGFVECGLRHTTRGREPLIDFRLSLCA